MYFDHRLETAHKNLQYRESTVLKEINKHIKMDRKFWAGPAQDIWVPWAG